MKIEYQALSHTRLNRLFEFTTLAQKIEARTDSHLEQAYLWNKRLTPFL